MQNRGRCGKLKQIISRARQRRVRKKTDGDQTQIPPQSAAEGRKNTMKCNHCGAEIAPEEKVCPACGQEVEETAAACTPETDTEEVQGLDENEARAEDETDAAAEDAEPAPEDAEDACAASSGEAEPTDPTPAQKKSKRGLVIGCVAGALALVAVFAAVKISKDAKTPKADEMPAASQSESAQNEGTQGSVMHTNEAGYTSYTATAEQLDDAELALVIATCGGKEMTNRDLNLYYWQQYYTFANNYGSYLSYLMDSTKGLDEQAYSEEQTWQQAFLSGAADMFHSIAALNLEADEAGFELPEEDENEIAAIPESLDATAAYYGFDSGLAYLQASFGPAVSVEDYLAFVRDNMRASRYMQKLIDEIALTDQEISDYYDENAETYEANRVLKVDKPLVNVRHILVMPQEQDENGEYTDAAWIEAEQKAQKILNEWQSGEATEDSFAALAGEYSEDPGSASNGGLYTDVYPGQMIDEFDAWCFDDARQAGDTAIVKTDYGYHIMYYVSQGEEIYWLETARGDMLSERSVELEDALREKYPMETNFDDAAIFDVQAESRAAAAEQAAAEEAAAQDQTGADESEQSADAAGGASDSEAE